MEVWLPFLFTLFYICSIILPSRHVIKSLCTRLFFWKPCAQELAMSVTSQYVTFELFAQLFLSSQIPQIFLRIVYYVTLFINYGATSWWTVELCDLTLLPMLLFTFTHTPTRRFNPGLRYSRVTRWQGKGGVVIVPGSPACVVAFCLYVFFL